MRDLRSTLYGAILALALILTSFFLFYDRVRTDYVFATATVVMGLAIGFIPLSFRFMGAKESEESAIASYGLVGTGSIAIAIAGVVSYSFSFFGHSNAAIVSLVGTFLLGVGFFFIISFSDTSLDTLSKRKNYFSNHAQWARDLSDIVARSESPGVRAAVQQRVERCRFLARDAEGFSPLADEINDCIGRIFTSVAAGAEPATMLALSELDGLFELRGDQLKRVRSKV